MKMKRTGVGSEITTITEKVTPHKNVVDVNIMNVCMIQSMVYASVGLVISIVGFVYYPWARVEVYMALPVIGLAAPWIIEALAAYQVQARYAAMRRNTLDIEIAAQNRILGDYNQDGVVDAEDQIQFEQDLAFFVRRITNVQEPMTRRFWWKKHNWRHARWKEVIRALAAAHVIEVSVSRKTGAVTPKSINVKDADSGITMIENAGLFQETEAKDYRVRSGTFVKNSRNPVASDGAWDGPVTSLGIDRPTE